MRYSGFDGSAGTRRWPHRPVLERFQNAFRGIWAAYTEEPNLRFHVFAAAGVLALGISAGVSRLEGLYLLGSIVLVLMAEMFNTAVERAADLASGGRLHALAGRAKDTAAGAVLLSVLHGVTAGVWIFLVPGGPAPLLARVVDYAARHALVAALLGLLVLVSGIVGLMTGRGPGTGDPHP